MIRRLLLQFNRYLILGVCCAIQGIIASACSIDRPEEADTLMVNAKIITVDSAFSIHEALAIKAGKILAIGSNRHIQTYQGSDTKVIDLEGHTVIPGIIEGHVHPVMAAESEVREEIPNIRSVFELLNWIREEAGRKDEGEWIIHPKFFATRMMEMRGPSLRELDSVAPHHPVFLDGSYGGMVNTCALRVSDIDDPSGHPGILIDPVSGKPTGHIRNSAFPLFKTDREPLADDSLKLEVLKDMLLHYNRMGITSICSGMGGTGMLNMFRSLNEKGDLTVRVFQNIRVPFPADASEKEMQTALEELGYRTGDGDNWVKVGALKTLVDGGVLTGTAFLRSPWGPESEQIYGIKDPEYRGVLFLTKDDLVRMITVATRTGWKFTAHVTGGGGVDTLLSAYQAVNVDFPLGGRRNSIIHGNFFSPGSIEIMEELGIYADMQPAWFYKDADLLQKVLGPDRMKDFHPYRSLIEAGIRVNGGSDHMVKKDPNTSINPYNPFLGMWTTITRQTERGSVINAGEAISREDALRMYTINNAYASFEEDLKGSLEVGKVADLAVLSLDILSCPVDEIPRVGVGMTMVDGKIVYQAEGWPVE